MNSEKNFYGMTLIYRELERLGEVFDLPFPDENGNVLVGFAKMPFGQYVKGAVLYDFYDNPIQFRNFIKIAKDSGIDTDKCFSQAYESCKSVCAWKDVKKKVNAKNEVCSFLSHRGNIVSSLSNEDMVDFSKMFKFLFNEDGCLVYYEEPVKTKGVYDMTASEIFASMNDKEKDALYRILWSDYIAEDVNGALYQMSDKKIANMDNDDYDELVEAVVNRYVYNGEHNRNIPYWDNINSLIMEELEKA